MRREVSVLTKALCVRVQRALACECTATLSTTIIRPDCVPSVFVSQTLLMQCEKMFQALALNISNEPELSFAKDMERFSM